MSIKIIKKTIFLLSLSLIFGCKTKDTCNAKLGNTFKELNLIEYKLNNKGNLLIQIKMEVLKVLPNTYFDDYILIRRKKDLFGNPITNSSEKLKMIDLNKQEMNLLIFQDSLPPVGNKEDLYFYMKFPDRIKYVNCTHPGSSDSYYLYLEFRINRIKKDSILLSGFKWQEMLNKGGF